MTGDSDPMTLIEFLRARLDEDEQTAQGAAHNSPGRWKARTHEGDPWIVTDDHGEFVVHDEGRPSEEQAQHIARHDPARVLAEVAAKRRVVASYVEAAAATDITSWQRSVALGMAVRLLASVYADHPDYDPGWAP